MNNAQFCSWKVLPWTCNATAFVESVDIVNVEEPAELPKKEHSMIATFSLNEPMAIAPAGASDWASVPLPALLLKVQASSCTLLGCPLHPVPCEQGVA
jgi:hypothetical protein